MQRFTRTAPPRVIEKTQICVHFTAKTVKSGHGIFPYARTSPFGINGGYYFARFSVRF